VLALVCFVILCGLGTWQVQRLGWKEDLIARVESRTTLPTEPAPGPETWPGIEYDELDYRPVSVVGTFRNDLEIFVYAALSEPKGPVGGQGYFVLTPFETEDGWTVIVNRGFVPEENKDPSTRLAGQIAGTVEVDGLLRRPQGRNAFTPADDVEANIWFTRDPQAIGEALALGPGLAPYYIDAFFDPGLPGGLPQGGETELSFPNNHLQYAITWYGLALALAVIFVARMRAGSRRKNSSVEGAA
jgi:surfeit locus 1 family protein